MGCHLETFLKRLSLFYRHFWKFMRRVSLFKFYRKIFQKLINFRVFRPVFGLTSGQTVSGLQIDSENMEDELLSRWIQEAVFASYMEECQILNELDCSYGYDYNSTQELSGNGCSTRKRKMVSSDQNVDTVSAGKHARNSWFQESPLARYCRFLQTIKTRNCLQKSLQLERDGNEYLTRTEDRLKTSRAAGRSRTTSVSRRLSFWKIDNIFYLTGCSYMALGIHGATF